MKITKDDIREYLYDQSRISSEVLSEREIAGQFAIKRGHARELLLELVGQGVVERRPRSGYRYVNYRKTSASSVLLLRFIVEEEAADKAVKNADYEDDRQLIQANNELQKAAEVEDPAAFAAADLAFHTALVRASHDNMLINIFDFLRSTLFRREDLTNLIFSKKLLATLKAHEDILDAFLKRDGDAFIHRLKRHLGYHKLSDKLIRLAEPIPEEYDVKDVADQ